VLDFERRLKTSLGLTKQQNPQKVILSLSYKNQKSHAETEPRIWTQFGAKAAQLKLSYHSVLSDEKEIPTWIDAVLKKALQPNSNKRYQVLSSFIMLVEHNGIGLNGKFLPYKSW
jgi:hypothetical protein